MKPFWKDIQLIKYCQWPGCKAEFRPKRFSYRAVYGYCIIHWRMYNTQQHRKWYRSLPEEHKARLKLLAKESWKRWLENNPERRRENALRSYHHRKEENRMKRKVRRKEFYRKTGK